MTEDPKPNRPTHELKILDIESRDTSQVGVAWLRDDDAISIKLNPGVVLSYDTMKGKALTLFRLRTKEEWDAHHASRKQQSDQSRQEYPLYVRKVHYSPFTKKECLNRTLGKPDLTDNPSNVTCGRCKRVLQLQGKGN
jgi:hypothetical protein